MCSPHITLANGLYPSVHILKVHVTMWPFSTSQAAPQCLSPLQHANTIQGRIGVDMRGMCALGPLLLLLYGKARSVTYYDSILIMPNPVWLVDAHPSYSWVMLLAMSNAMDSPMVEMSWKVKATVHPVACRQSHVGGCRHLSHGNPVTTLMGELVP